jgi:cell division protein FtsL
MISGVLVIVALLVAPYVRPWLAQRSQLAQGRAEVQRLELEVARLQTERNRWDDPAYVEQQARRRLGLLKPGEVGYVPIEPTAPSRATDPRSAEAAVPPRHDAAWYGTLWQSVVGAGAPAPAAVPPATAPLGTGDGTP